MRKIGLYLSAEDVMGDRIYSEHLWKKKQAIETLLVCARRDGRLIMVVCGVFAVCLQCVCGVFVVCLRCVCGVFVMCLWCVCGVFVVC
jgi:hypothetical protein